jgi:competence protein ComEA
MKIITALLLGLALITSNAFAAVNVNTATQEELETLNGIGPVKAKAIIDYRKQHGPFKSVEELDNVPGIGQGVLSKIKGDVTLTGPTTVKGEGKPAEKAGTKKAEPAKPATPATPATKAESATPAATAPAAKADTAQQDKMKDCNAQAGKKELKGDERKAFMKSCLSAKPDKKDEKAGKKETKAETKEEKKLTPRQQKMKDCNAQAGDKKLVGDDRKKFMNTCLSAK